MLFLHSHKRRNSSCIRLKAVNAERGLEKTIMVIIRAGQTTTIKVKQAE
jgi:hypothetical protein